MSPDAAGCALAIDAASRTRQSEVSSGFMSEPVSDCGVNAPAPVPKLRAAARSALAGVVKQFKRPLRRESNLQPTAEHVRIIVARRCEYGLRIRKLLSARAQRQIDRARDRLHDVET